MTTLTTLLFDVDGTLAETEEIHRQAFNRAFADADLDWHWSRHTYGQLLAVTGGKERIRHFIDTRGPDFAIPGDAAAFIAGLHAAKTAIYTTLVAAGEVPMRPGVKRLLEDARRAGLRLAIATTTTPANVTALLTHNLAPDSLDWFEVIGAGSMVPNKKPAPDIYAYVLQEMGVDAAACLAFEDTQNGLRAATACGLSTLVTVSQYSEGQDFSAAAVVLDQLGEPDAPCRVLVGDAGECAYVGVEQLRYIHARQHQSRRD